MTTVASPLADSDQAAGGDNERAPINPFLRRLTIYSSGGPLLDGYALSIIGLALTQATGDLKLTVSEQGLIGAASLIGIFLGAFTGGWLTDRFGRQKLYTLDLLAIFIFSVIQFWAADGMQLFLMRILLGIAIGADYPIATSLLAEFAPTQHRGRLLGALIVMWFVGSALAYLVGTAILSLSPHAWRWLLITPAAPAAIFVMLRHGTPESPRWLASQGRVEEANLVHIQAFGTPYAGAETSDQGGTSLWALFSGGYGRRILFVATFWTCSAVPMFAVYAFGPAILLALGLNHTLTDLGSIIITLCLLAGCMLLLLVMDRIGRRKLMIHSFLWSGFMFLGLAFAKPDYPILILLLLVGFSFAISPTQIMQWVYPNELFPTRVRGSAVGLASSLSRIGAAIGTYLVPLSLSNIGIQTTMLIAAAINFVGFVVAIVGAPETLGRNLDETAALN